MKTEPNPNYFPCGRTRREFVWQMGGGFAGLALADLLAALQNLDVKPTKNSLWNG